MNFFKDLLVDSNTNKQSRKYLRRSPKNFEAILKMETISDAFAEFVVSYEAIAYLDLLHLTQSYKIQEESKKKTIGDRIFNLYLNSELYEKDFFLSEQEMKETLELYEKNQENCFEHLENNVFSVLRYLFIRFRQTSTWINYSHANFDDKLLFQETYKLTKGTVQNLPRIKDRKKIDSFLFIKYDSLTEKDSILCQEKFKNLKKDCIKCENIVQCFDIFREEEDTGTLFEVILVIKEFSMNLHRFIQEESSERKSFSNYVKISSVLTC
jgi:hypothetical protein